MTPRCGSIRVARHIPHPVPDNVVTAFWGNVSIGAEDECWPWVGPQVGHDGRGRFTYLVSRSAPRLALVIGKGPPPNDSMHACHHCDNPPCCNPRHLWWGTNKENMMDASKKGRLLFRTHCREGHEYTPENTIMRRDRGWVARQCRKCVRAWQNQQRRRKTQRMRELRKQGTES